MSLLDDLQGIDLTSVLEGRADISALINSEDLQTLIGGEGISSALGSVGTAITALQNAQENPEALLMPLIEAVADVGELFDSGDLPLTEYINIVREGAQIVTQLFALIGSGNPSEFSMPNGDKLGEILNHTANFSQHFSSVGFDQANNVKHIIDTVEQGLPQDPSAFAEYAVELMMPFSSSSLVAIRNSVSTMIEGAAQIRIDVNINSGALSSLERLRLAGEARDGLAVNRELVQLNNIRQNFLNALRNALQRGTAQIQALNIDQHMREIEALADGFQVSSAGVIEFLDKLRAQFAAMRELVETTALPDLGPIIDDIANKTEALLRDTVEKPIDQAVNDVKTWLRNQLAQLNLRYYRGLLTKFFKDVEREIIAANLDGPARQARAFLDEIENVINNFDLSADIQGALGDVGTTITDTVNTLEGALQSIVDGVNAAAASARDILERVADLLEQFQQTVDGITQAVENLGIEQARDAVINAIEDLRSTAESILGNVPLPDVMRPLVDEVIKELDKIDVDEVLKPVFDALGQLQIPPSVLDPINEVLQEASTVIQNLITEELIRQLDEEFSKALEEINKFDPATLLSEVTDFFDEAADFIEQLDPRPIVAEIRGPYDAVVQAIDAIHPNRILRPVIEAYEGVFSAIEMPNPSESLSGLNNTLNEAGEQIGQQVSQPLQQLSGQQARDSNATSGSNASGTNASGNAAPQTPETLPEIRPGDIIRLLGYVPNKLREALQEMQAGPAGEAMQMIDGLCSGLAQQLRQLQQQLWQAERQIFNGIDTVLKPLSSAQMQAQLALQASFSADAQVNIGGGQANAEVDVSGAVTLLGSFSTGAMRNELAPELAAARQSIAAIIGRAGGPGGAFLDRLIHLLENCALGKLGNDLDALLQALDPEPLAAELDAVARAAINRLPEITQILDDGAQQAIQRIIMLIQQFNPVAQGMKFLTVFDVIREELEILNPRRLAAELAEIHNALRNIILAYDPGVFAEEVYDVVEAVANQIRALDPGALIGDLSQFDSLTETLANLNPSTALASIDDELDEVGARLAQIDLASLLDAVNDLPGRVEDSVTSAGQAVIDNLKGLLESIKYFSNNASASASVSVG